MARVASCIRQTAAEISLRRIFVLTPTAWLHTALDPRRHNGLPESTAPERLSSAPAKPLRAGGAGETPRQDPRGSASTL